MLHLGLPCIHLSCAGARRCSTPPTPCSHDFGAGARKCSTTKPHSMHLLLQRACSQMLDPPHSLHRLLFRWCPPPPPSPFWLALSPALSHLLALFLRIPLPPFLISLCTLTLSFITSLPAYSCHLLLANARSPCIPCIGS